MNEKIKQEAENLYLEGLEVLKKFLDDKDDEDKSENRIKYQVWYTKSELVIKEFLPTRYKEFIGCYKTEKRKEYDCSNYCIYDYFTGIYVTRGGKELFNCKDIAMTNFSLQLTILNALRENLDSILFNIIENIECEIFDNELESAKKLLKNKFLRAAGAICGVVLEKHFSTVLKHHDLTINKKEPCISDYNDLCKKEKIYDIINWRFVQHLGDIRNLCDHNKGREPTKEEVEELIEGTDKVIKTIF